jgi:multiple sugar transport system permease protein
VAEITAVRPAVRAEAMPLWDRIKIPLFYALLLSWTLIAVLPYWLTVVFSFMPKTAIFDPPRLWPSPFTLENYRAVLTAFDEFPLWLRNSLLFALAATILRVLFSSMAGYAFARMRFPGRGLLFTLILGSMMLPGVAMIVPQYWMAVKWFKMVDTLHGLIIIWTGANFAFGVFMMTQFFKQFPRDLEEAAFIDGAGWFTTFFRVVLPLARPALLALAIFSFQGSWNDFFLSLVLLQTPDNFTLPLGLAMFRFQYYAIYSNVLAGSMFNSVPIMIIFFVFQRYFVQGIAYTGLKGV